MARSLEIGICVELNEVVARLARVVGVREEVWNVAGPRGEIGVVRVVPWTRVGALDKVA